MHWQLQDVQQGEHWVNSMSFSQSLELLAFHLDRFTVLKQKECERFLGCELTPGVW
jgi:hypothetical protein